MGLPLKKFTIQIVFLQKTHFCKKSWIIPSWKQGGWVGQAGRCGCGD